MRPTYIMKTKITPNEFFSKLVEIFPDAAQSGQYTRAMINSTSNALNNTKVYPWMTENKLTRAVYRLPGFDVVAVPANVVHEPVMENVITKLRPIVQAVHAETSTVSMIPEKDSNYVPFGNYKDLEMIITSGIFYPTYICGPSGNGKSTMVEQICAKHKRALIRVNLNSMSDEEQLIGSKTLKDGNVEIVEGPVLIAMRSGTTLLLDEITAGNPNLLLCLQGILEGRPYYFKLKNEIIHPAPGFNIIATDNTKGKGSDDGKYIGTNVQNEAFLERFAVTLEQEYPDSKTELKIVKNLMNQYNCVDDEFASVLVKWCDAIRKTYYDGGVDEIITTRRITHIVRAFSIFKNKTKAVTLCCQRFDVSTKAAFVDLFDKMCEPEPEDEQLKVNETETSDVSVDSEFQ